MKNLFMKESFNDFDALSHAVQDWDLDFRQLDTGPLHAEILQFSRTNSLIGHARFSRRFDQRGAAPPGLWTFGIFSRRCPSLVWHVNEIENSYVVIYKPGSEIDCVSKPGFEVFTLSCPEEHLQKIAQHRGLPEVQKLANGVDHLWVSAKNLSVIRFLIRKMILTAEEPETLGSSALTYYEDEIFGLILSILNNSQPVQNVSSLSGKRAIKKIKDFLTAHPNEVITISKLCTIGGVSARTLQYAFLEHYGISPKTYLIYYRLNGARRDLWISDPGTSRVNNIAIFWGFWHMGQFAADYRKLFGELPSETLQRRK
jgi:AraC family transcriptional regulator, ethanolamine operon transcriptional activator